MVDRLRQAGAVTTAPVERALLVVAREVFVPPDDLSAAYDDRAIIVKRSGEGQPTSSVSQPTIVATMLEALAVEPGDHVLEIGTGPGYNAALLAHLVGDGGGVVSIDIDEELAQLARGRLMRVGVDRVEVVCADGRRGHDTGVPYERIIVTTGARSIERAWFEQLAVGGVLVSPLVDAAGMGVLVRCERDGHGVTQNVIGPCAFLPMLD